MRKLLGWAEGRDKWGDSTLISHLVVSQDGDTQSRLACGRHVRVSGYVEPEPTTGRKCEGCLRATRRQYKGTPGTEG